MSRRPRVAFVCTHNACRSQIAETIAHAHAADVLEAYSAGTDPAVAPNQDALRLLADAGFDIAPLRTKTLGELPPVDMVITMGCGVQCPNLPCAHREDWGLEDPTGKGDEAMRACIKAITAKIDDLAGRIRRKELPSHSERAVGAESAAAFRALADDNRLAIVAILAQNKELCACKLLDRLSISQSTLSHHMKALVAAGLVEQRKEGRWMHYRLCGEKISALGAALTSLGANAQAADAKRKPAACASAATGR